MMHMKYYVIQVTFSSNVTTKNRKQHQQLDGNRVKSFQLTLLFFLHVVYFEQIKNR